MQVLPHSPVTKLLLRPNHKWTPYDRLLLAQLLNGTLLNTGNIRFSGVFGKPEYVKFNRTHLAALLTSEHKYIDTAARNTIMARIMSVGMELAKRLAGGHRA